MSLCTKSQSPSPKPSPRAASMRLLGLTAAVITATSSLNVLALPLTSAQPWSSKQAHATFLNTFNFDGIVALSNCSASFVRLPGAPDSAKGLVLTNGHCVSLSPFGGFIQPGEVYYRQPRRYSMSLLDQNGSRIATLRSETILYATMTNTDMALLELNQTYAQIKAQTGVDARPITSVRPAEGTKIEIPSGYWTRTYSCQIEAFIPQLREDGWTFTDSLRYSPTGCEVIGGTSGSPILDSATGVVIGINNTGNESGDRCTMNNPCEVDQSGRVTVIKGRGYGQQVYHLASCIDGNGQLDLSVAGCQLPKP